MRNLLLAVAMGAGLLFGQPNELNLRQDPPPAIQSERVTATYTGAAGATTYYYWIVARYPIGFTVPTAPVIVARAASTLGGGNSVALSWTALAGASSYDVLRTSTPAAPSSCTCAVTLATTSTTATDSGGALSTWPPAGLHAAGAAQMTLQINNRDGGAPYIEMAVQNAQRALNYQLGLLKNGPAPSYVPSGFIQTYANQYSRLACADSSGADCLNFIANAQDYGAVGDGSTDNTQALNNALAARNNAEIPYSSLGYRINGTVRIGDRQQLNCNGSALIMATAGQIGVDMQGSYGTLNNCFITTTGVLSGSVGIRVKPSGTLALFNNVTQTRIEGPDKGIQLDSVTLGNYYNYFADITIRFVTTGIEITADGTANRSNRNQFHKVVVRNATTAVDIVYGDTNAFFGLAVEGVTDGFRVRNNPGNGENAVYGLFAESVTGNAVKLDGTNAYRTVLHNVLVDSGSIADAGTYTFINSPYGSTLTNPTKIVASPLSIQLNPDGASTQSAVIASNAGASGNYNGTTLTNNEKPDGTQGNTGLPTWRLDLGGYDAPTYTGSEDAFTLWRKPAAGAFARAFRVGSAGQVNPGTVTFAALPASPINGDIVYCSDCTKATPCASGGSGAIAKRINGAWDCN